MRDENGAIIPDPDLAYATPDMDENERRALGVATARYFRQQMVYTTNFNMIHPGRVQLKQEMEEWNEFCDPMYDDDELDSFVDDALE